MYNFERENKKSFWCLKCTFTLHENCQVFILKILKITHTSYYMWKFYFFFLLIISDANEKSLEATPITPGSEIKFKFHLDNRVCTIDETISPTLSTKNGIKTIKE